MFVSWTSCLRRGYLHMWQVSITCMTFHCFRFRDSVTCFFSRFLQSPFFHYRSVTWHQMPVTTTIFTSLSTYACSFMIIWVHLCIWLGAPHSVFPFRIPPYSLFFCVWSDQAHSSLGHWIRSAQTPANQNCLSILLRGRSWLAYL